MRTTFRNLFVLGGCVTIGSFAGESALLKVVVEEPNRSSCQVYVAVYRDPGSWLSEKPFRFENQRMKLGFGTVIVKDLPPGKYAILAYCDFNGNGRLDESSDGVPQEPYGFSKGGPGSYEMSFSSAAFPVTSKREASGPGEVQKILLLRP
ncbi:MAG: DUF2141 domain-containing protein [Bryobacteraceae bacterium]|nr:DUF2141 domain-containing protein [Bryobacteraceae bacterium]